jgi:hypothetical protein
MVKAIVVKLAILVSAVLAMTFMQVALDLPWWTGCVPMLAVGWLLAEWELNE